MPLNKVPKKDNSLPTHFWEGKTLAQLSADEWEALCDGCGQCCLYKLEDEDSGDIYLTNVVCRFLDRTTGQCQVYPERRQAVPTCVQLNPLNVLELSWIPPTCAYKLVGEGKPLTAWHPLISGNKSNNHRAEFFLGDQVISETEIDMNDLEDHVIS
jgi:uncharacterized cysteine cluster protein YcgN (CxxCxxCC family)